MKTQEWKDCYAYRNIGIRGSNAKYETGMKELNEQRKKKKKIISVIERDCLCVGFSTRKSSPSTLSSSGTTTYSSCFLLTQALTAVTCTTSRRMTLRSWGPYQMLSIMTLPQMWWVVGASWPCLRCGELLGHHDLASDVVNCWGIGSLPQMWWVVRASWPCLRCGELLGHHDLASDVVSC